MSSLFRKKRWKRCIICNDFVTTKYFAIKQADIIDYHLEQILWKFHLLSRPRSRDTHDFVLRQPRECFQPIAETTQACQPYQHVSVWYTQLSSINTNDLWPSSEFKTWQHLTMQHKVSNWFLSLCIVCMMLRMNDFYSLLFWQQALYI